MVLDDDPRLDKATQVASRNHLHQPVLDETASSEDANKKFAQQVIFFLHYFSANLCFRHQPNCPSFPNATPEARTESEVLIMEFRRDVTGFNWHWCANCPEWPVDKSYNVLHVDNLPSTFQLCKECELLRDCEDCRSIRHPEEPARLFHRLAV